MNQSDIDRLALRMGEFTAHIGRALGSLPQRKRFAEYALGLLLPGERKSMEPIAARIDPKHTMARFKTFQNFIGCSDWDDHAVRRAAYTWAQPVIERSGPVLAWIFDDTGFVKQGKHSVFVQHQYTGTAGKLCNCQVAVSMSIATEALSMPVDYDLYMPETWVSDAERRMEAKVPADLEFRTKPQIALDMIDRALSDGIPPAPAVMDSGYGDNGPFRATLDCMGMEYVAEIKAKTTVIVGDDPKAPSISVRDLAASLPPSAFRRVTWREGTKGKMSARFATRRVLVPDDEGKEFRKDPKLTLLIEWVDGEAAPKKFWLANLPKGTTRKRLVRLAHIRWRVERDYEDLKQELGLDHYEGRGYVGWNHHVSVCLAAFAFLLRERALGFPPRGASFQALCPRPVEVRPRGSAAAA
jgi:SRSO17 transposase